MAKGGKTDRIDPAWPGDDDHGRHPVSETTADRQGALSPFGELEFPIPPDRLGYEHPVTEINWEP
ncbi:MAG TPA: hypothetical protein VFV67_13575 [Actinophytocola sp.]|uniref:hypothetical protein n=1 Tax=Actinophytocola sp. TaxID=1872138 RepID=UPI002DBA0E96|nr:hypothetical protein [Actinophytocola sp.]HEU5471676.1 hypothetical protein [Actinophytocola sp.]